MSCPRPQAHDLCCCTQHNLHRTAMIAHSLHMLLPPETDQLTSFPCAAAAVCPASASVLLLRSR